VFAADLAVSERCGIAEEVADLVSNTVGVDRVPLMYTRDVDQHFDEGASREVSLPAGEADDARRLFAFGVGADGLRGGAGDRPRQSVRGVGRGGLGGGCLTATSGCRGRETVRRFSGRRSRRSSSPRLIGDKGLDGGDRCQIPLPSVAKASMARR